MSSPRRLRPNRWLTLVVHRSAPRDPEVGGAPIATRRLFLSAAWLLAAVGLLVPAVEGVVLLHDRRATSRAFACLAAAEATAAATAVGSAEADAEGDQAEIDVDGFGRFRFPPGLSEQETVAALQALAVAHHAAGHGAHSSSAPPPRPPPAADRAEATAAMERGCAVARADGERYAWRAWRPDYGREAPSERRDQAEGRAWARALLAAVPFVLLLGLRRWWRWLRSPSPPLP